MDTYLAWLNEMSGVLWIDDSGHGNSQHTGMILYVIFYATFADFGRGIVQIGVILYQMT